MSQVSCSASFSRFISGSDIESAKPFFVWRAITPSIRPSWVEINDDALAEFAANRCEQRYAADRHVERLTGIFPLVGQHVAAENGHLHPLVAALFNRLLSHTQFEIHLQAGRS